MQLRPRSHSSASAHARQCASLQHKCPPVSPSTNPLSGRFPTLQLLIRPRRAAGGTSGHGRSQKASTGENGAKIMPPVITSGAAGFRHIPRQCTTCGTAIYFTFEGWWIELVTNCVVVSSFREQQQVTTCPSPLAARDNGTHGIPLSPRALRMLCNHAMQWTTLMSQHQQY